jgi:hypothetical protein
VFGQIRRHPFAAQSVNSAERVSITTMLLPEGTKKSPQFGKAHAAHRLHFAL